ncbi:deoxyribonuclease IV [Actinopolymorpha pittospori]|uniref:Probable endonuclease 4 n=1 Tax=Actinopolymorpha pittospori TaxID=648752 RepID=A0A927N9L1_9ACTN|nr:deoxyribonuclease-4 [Actinopolymorpha pittospori]
MSPSPPSARTARTARTAQPSKAAKPTRTGRSTKAARPKSTSKSTPAPARTRARQAAPTTAGDDASAPRTARRLDPPVGCHVAVSGGLAKGAFRKAGEIGAETLQVFVGNPRGWAIAAGDPAEDERFRSLCEEAGVPAFVHTPYLVNFGSPTPDTLRRSIDVVAHNLARAQTIGARGVVVHTGSCVAEGGYDQAMRQVREAVLPLLDALPDGAPPLLLEPTAGQGRSLCAGLEDLPAYFDALDGHPMLGVCLDTCHVFAAGAPLDEPDGMARTLDRLVDLVGPGRLRLVHANDSKDPRGSLRDRHERIGQGHIGVPAFDALVRHPAMSGVPIVLETPGGDQASREDLALLKWSRDR